MAARSRRSRPCRRCRSGCWRRACASRAALPLPAELLTLDPGAARRCWRRWHEHARPPSASTRCCPPSTACATPSRASRCARWSPPFAQEFAALEENVEQLYDDQFIETCADWVAPYIGDLIGYRPLHGVAPHVASPRAEVANTIAYRRRKGTARCWSSWRATSPTGRRTRWSSSSSSPTTQYMKHIRLHAPATADLRDLAAAAASGRRVQRRRAHAPRCAGPRAGAGRYNIPNIGIFLWRLQPFAPERRAADRRPRRCQRPQVPLQSAGRRPAAVPPRRAPRTTITHISPSRSTCPSP